MPTANPAFPGGQPHPALSADGYIISQDNTAHIPYGRASSDYSGCGWIAAYNLIKATGGAPEVKALSEALAYGGWFKGRGGTGPFRLRRFLEGRGFSFKTTFSKRKAPALAAGADAGILFYVAGIEPHFVAFMRAPGGLRFFNAIDGAQNHLSTMEDFVRKNVKIPLMYLMVTT